MGAGQAESMAEMIQEGFFTLEAALAHHLTANHYPPVPTIMVPVCVAAIDAIQRYENDYKIDLPDGVTWRDQTQVPAWAVAEDLHLDAFLEEVHDM